MNYNYREAIISDISEYLLSNYTVQEVFDKLSDRDNWEEELQEDLWVCDSVTGNASGSYWFNSYKAERALVGNWDLLADAFSEFGYDCVNILHNGAEYCDVTIRCYLLGECLAEVLDDLEEEIEREQEEEA